MSQNLINWNDFFEFHFFQINFFLKLNRKKDKMIQFDPQKHHRRSIRLKGYDYSKQGFYFITICCEDKAKIFGEIIDGKMNFTADSDAIITKGIIGLLIRVLNSEDPKTVVETDLHFIKNIGLQEHLSPTRANGLAGMVKKMKIEALKNIKV